MDGPCSILDCGYDTHPRPPSFHFSFSVRVIDFGWRPQCTVNSFCILTSVASVSSWMSKPIDDLNLISTIQLSSKHLSPVVSAWLWWTSVHLSHSSCWLVRYPNTCSCPLYDCFLLKPPLQSHSHTLHHSGPWGHICPIWMTSLYSQCNQHLAHSWHKAWWHPCAGGVWWSPKSRIYICFHSFWQDGLAG